MVVDLRDIVQHVAVTCEQSSSRMCIVSSRGVTCATGTEFVVAMPATHAVLVSSLHVVPEETVTDDVTTRTAGPDAVGVGFWVGAVVGKLVGELDGAGVVGELDGAGAVGELDAPYSFQLAKSKQADGRLQSATSNHAAA